MKRSMKSFLATALAFTMAFSMVSNEALAAGMEGKITSEQVSEALIAAPEGEELLGTLEGEDLFEAPEGEELPVALESGDEQNDPQEDILAEEGIAELDGASAREDAEVQAKDATSVYFVEATATLHLRGNVVKEEVRAYSSNESVLHVVADSNTVLPEDCSYL
ncbi:MAG: hypothetical protein J6Z22_05545, partial [Lachnospiraceae bacterium]|nr:hypothetical protein [Lachnospiraceae bacterium]